MKHLIKMPRVAETTDEVYLVSWSKSIGDRIEVERAGRIAQQLQQSKQSAYDPDQQQHNNDLDPLDIAQF